MWDIKEIKPSEQIAQYDFHLNHVGYKVGLALLGVAAAITFHLNHVGYKEFS